MKETLDFINLVYQSNKLPAFYKSVRFWGKLTL
jgi:hypothetical protein